MPAGDGIRIAAAAVAAAGDEIETAIEAVQNGSVSFDQVKTALTGVGSALTPHTEASNAMAGLLIDQSNFGGQEQ